ncbi:Mocs1 protein [Coccidioides immitis H538.4]|uniref:Mocs1 protein n=1 Tax=Coccidioides immitis H538.4 TaxID=396776 RepID=A0A0J8RCP2_COCIT|nr:Mocs1 protein [Coccidioides immitis H538.4]
MGREKPVEVRFIEYMRSTGTKWSQGKMFPYKDMLRVIREKYPSLEKVQDHKNDTSKTYQVPGFAGRVSLRDMIRKENSGEPIDAQALQTLGLLESAQQSARAEREGLDVHERERQLLDIIGAAVKRKKAKHAGMGELENMKNRPMILIEGFWSIRREIRTMTFTNSMNNDDDDDDDHEPNYTPVSATSVLGQSGHMRRSRFARQKAWTSIPTYILPSFTPSRQISQQLHIQSFRI